MSIMTYVIIDIIIYALGGEDYSKWIYRVIAPDYNGFGLPEKPDGWSLPPGDRAEVNRAFNPAAAYTRNQAPDCLVEKYSRS